MVMTFHPASRSKGWSNRNSPGQQYLDWGWGGAYSLRLSHTYEPQFLYLLNETSSKEENTCKSYLHRRLVCRSKPEFRSTSSCNSACVRAKLLQSHPILCNPMDCSPPNSSVHGIFHAGTLEWVATPSSRGIFPTQYQTHISYASCTGRWILYQLCHLGSP